MKSNFTWRFLTGISVVPLTALSILMSPVSSSEVEAKWHKGFQRKGKSLRSSARSQKSSKATARSSSRRKKISSRRLRRKALSLRKGKPRLLDVKRKENI